MKLIRFGLRMILEVMKLEGSNCSRYRATIPKFLGQVEVLCEVLNVISPRRSTSSDSAAAPGRELHSFEPRVG